MHRKANNDNDLIGCDKPVRHRWCQWIESDPLDIPYGADPDSIYCGEPVQEGSSYCEEHHAMVWIKPKSDPEDVVRQPPRPWRVNRVGPKAMDMRLPR